MLELGGARFELVEVPVDGAQVTATERTPGQDGPLTVVARFETVHLHRPGGGSLVITGIPARIVSELASFGAPAPWEMVARSIWKGEPDRFVVRRNWDRHLKALRGKLREAGCRDDLVRADGCGNVELFLLPGDEVVDEG